MSLDVQVKIEGANPAVAAADKVTAALDRMEDKGPQAGAAISRGMSEAQRAMSTLAQGFRGIENAIGREQRMLDSMRGSMRQYQQDHQLLDSMLKRNVISLNEYTAALAKARSSAGVANPAAAVSLPSAPAGNASPLAGIQSAVMGIAGPAALAGTALSVITEEMERWGAHDRMIMNATNSMLRFHDSAREAAAAVGEQVKASQLLGVTVHEQIEAFDAVSDASEHLTKTHGQLMDITRNLSMAMIHNGKPIADVGRVMETLQYGMERGTLETREFKSIIKGLPEIADMMAKSLGTTRDGLMDMAKAGGIGRVQIAKMLSGFEDGAEVAKVFAERQLDIKQVMEQQNLAFTDAMQVVINHKKLVEEATSSVTAAEREWRKWADAMTLVTMTMDSIDEKLDKADLKYWMDSFGSQHQQNLKIVTDSVKRYEDGLRRTKQELEAYNAEVERAAKLEARLRNIGDGSKHRGFGQIDSAAGGFGSIDPMSQNFTLPGGRNAALQANEQKQAMNDLARESQRYLDTQEQMRRNFELIGESIGKNLEDALVNAALQGEFSFRSMVDSIMADLTRLIAKQLIAAGLSAAIGGVTGPSPTSLASNPAGTILDPSAWGFATGGSFMVGGHGGTDSQPVQFMASPNERVTIETPEQQRSSSGGGSSGGGSVTLAIDPRSFLKVIDSPMGARVLDDMRRKYPTLR